MSLVLVFFFQMRKMFCCDLGSGFGGCCQRRSTEGVADDGREEETLGKNMGRTESKTGTESSDVSILL